MIYIELDRTPHRTWDIEASKVFPNAITIDYTKAEILILGLGMFEAFIDEDKILPNQKVFVYIENSLELDMLTKFCLHTVYIDLPNTISERLDTTINWCRPIRDVSKYSSFPSRNYKIVSVCDVQSPTFHYKDLLVAYHTVEQTSEKVSLDLFSTSPLKRGMETYNNIQFWGTQRNAKVFETIANSDFFLYPDSSDNFPTVVFEALKIGIPVIAKESIHFSASSNGIATYKTEEDLIRQIQIFYGMDYADFWLNYSQRELEKYIPEKALPKQALLDLITKVTK